MHWQGVSRYKDISIDEYYLLIFRTSGISETQDVTMGASGPEILEL